MRQQERQLVHRHRIGRRPREFVPLAGVRRRVDGLRDELVPRVRVHPAGRRYRTRQRVQEEEAASHLPAALVPGGGAAPVVGGESGSRSRHQFGDLGDRIGIQARLGRRELERVLGVDLPERSLESLERGRLGRPLLHHELLPVEPAAHVLAIVELVADQVIGDRQQDSGLGARVTRQPVVRVRGRVRKARIEDDHFRAALARFGDALRVRIEVVAGLQVR